MSQHLPFGIRALLGVTVTLALAITITITTACPSQKRTNYAKELRAFFSEVDKNYPFFKTKGITKDWKARKARLLKEVRRCRSDPDFMKLAFDAVAGLRDGHAGFTKIRPKLPQSDPDHYPGVVFLPATQRRVVVAATTASLKSKLPVGSVVHKIEGKNAREYLDGLGEIEWQKGGHFSSLQRASFFEYRLPLRGKRGAQFVVEASADKKKKRRISLRAQYPVKGWLHLYNPPTDLQSSARSVYHTTLDDEVGYIWLRRMDATAESGIGKAIEAHETVSRWVVDLRGNTGGGYDASIKRLITKLGKKVAVIVDAGAISAAETFARDLVNICKARVFGTQTAGSSSSKKEWTFPCGVATIRYSVRSRTGIGGKPIEFFGITPDVVIEPDPTDVARGHNTEILAAQAWLKK